MFNFSKKLILFGLLISGLFLLSSTSVWAQTNADEQIQPYINGLNNAREAGQGIDTLLYRGDQIFNQNPSPLSPEQATVYKRAREQYLIKRGSDIVTNRYTPGDDLYSIYANAEQQVLNISMTVRGLDDNIADLESQLAQDPTNQNLIDKLADTIARRDAAQTNLDDAQTTAVVAETAVTETESTTAQTATEQQADPGACWTWTGAINPGNCILAGAGWVGTILTWIVGSLLWLASQIFDLSVYMSIDMLGDWFNSEMVKSAWRILRDFANLGFVFILLYIALGTIFNLQGIQNQTKKLVVQVVIAALLVNFSGFFVRVVVDASNVVAYEFYSSMGGNTEAGHLQTIGSNLVYKLSLDKYYIKGGTNATMPDPQTGHLSFGSIIIQTFGNIIIILVTSFVLLVASVLFIIRSIWLLFLYIVSPVALASYALPRNNFFQKWLNSLIKQSLYAPGFLIPLFIVFSLIGDGGIGSTLGASGGVLAGSLTLVLFDILILGLIIGCIFVAQAVGAIGLGFATATGSAGLSAGLNPIKRYGGRLGRYAGNKITRNKEGELRKTSKWVAESSAGRLARRSWDTGTLGDVRRSKFGQDTAKVLSRPVASGVGALSGAMAKSIQGTKRIDNITGADTFTKQVEDKATKIYDEMKKIESPADKAKLIEGLADGGKKEELAVLYSKLEAGDRVKLEQEAIKTNPNGRLAKALVAQRQTLKGETAQKTAVEMVKESKGADKLKAVEKLDSNDFNRVYMDKDMKAQDRAEIEKFAGIDENMTKKITEAKNKLKEKNAAEGRKTDRIIEAANTLSGPFADPNVAFNPNDPAAQAAAMDKVEKIRALTPQEFKDFMDENKVFDGTHRDVYPYLTAEQLKIIKLEGGAKDDEWKAIKDAITNSRGTDNDNRHYTGKTDHPDKTLEKAHRYLNSMRLTSSMD